MKLLGTEIVHFVISLFVGVFFFDKAGWLGIVVALMSGFLIDSDHLIDYLMYEKNWKKLSIKKFLSSEHFEKSGKLHIFFHGWEYAIGFFCIGLLLNWWWLVALAVSNYLHLLVDQLTNDVNLKAYFVSYRFMKKWKSQCL